MSLLLDDDGNCLCEFCCRNDEELITYIECADCDSEIGYTCKWCLCNRFGICLIDTPDSDTDKKGYSSE